MATTEEIATAEEIDRRVDVVDTARSAKRSVAAKQVGELATSRSALAEQLDEIEQRLGEVIAEASDVLGIDELARFTGVPAVDLNRWFTAQKANRAKKKKTAASAGSDTSRRPATARTSTRTPPSGQASTPPEPVSRSDIANTQRVTEGVGA